MVVPSEGSLCATDDWWQPLVLTDPAGGAVKSVAAYFWDLQARGCSEATIRSYGMDLLRWFRLLWAIDVSRNSTAHAGSRDFCRWPLLPANRFARTGAFEYDGHIEALGVGT
ncbi:hypothetical protein [Rhodococcus opacus]|uniref:hypothetical protein n=1 Tax=Rhodococcus opacus TaxID=37919 RepID=UPI002473BD82|nr:hypothetical protein [Rhodococcus opacus]